MNRLHKTTRVALGATFLFATMLMAIPTKALECKNLNVVFMRGSSQNYTDTVEDINFPKWAFDPVDGIVFDKTNSINFINKEKEAARYFKNIGDRVHKDFPSLTMQFVSLHDIQGKYNSKGYRAVSAFGPASHLFVSQNALGAKFSDLDMGEYNQSVQDGAEELAGYLEDQMTSCPSQHNVVGGFSQGAHVVGEAMRLMHDRGQDNLLSRLGHIDMYGDPKFNGFDLQTSRLNPLQKHVTMPWFRGDAPTSYTGSLGARKPYVPDILTSKTASWCGQGDVVCGGIGALDGLNPKAHGDIYQTEGGFIDKSANEIYVDIKTRLALLAGLTDTSANSPLAYWNGIKHPKKLDVMFVMDRTGDETLSLSPEADYLSRNFRYLADSGLSSIFAGVVTYTEFSRFNGTKDVVESQPKTVTNLTSDIYGDYSYFKASWGPAHSQNPPFGGADLQDSPFSAINLALDQNYWRADARKVIVLFSNTYGKETEDSTTHTVKSITAKARAKDVEILPVFTSKTFRANPSRVDLVPTANAYWNKLAKGASGHYTEVTDLITEKLVYDVIMGHVYAPDVEITTAKSYNKPSTAGKKTAQSTTIKNTKPVLKKGKKATLSATKSNAPKSKVKTYAWDLNGDGVVDETSTLPDITFTPDVPFDGTITVTVTGEDGSSTTGYQDIQITDDDALVTHQEPGQLAAPAVQAVRNGTDVVLTWSPTEGNIIFMHDDGSIWAIVDASLGTFNVQDAPAEAFTMLAQLTNGNEQSDAIQIQIEAAPAPPTSTTGSSADSNINSTTNQPDLTLPQDAVPIPDNNQQQTQSTVNPQEQTSPSDTTTLAVTTQTPQVLGQSTTNPTTQTVQLTVNVTKQKSITTPINDAKEPTSTVVYTQKASPFTFAKIKAAYNPAGLLATIKFVFWTAVYTIWPDMTALLILVLLLLITLDISLRDHRKQQYKHDQQYDYKPLLPNTYKA